MMNQVNVLTQEVLNQVASIFSFEIEMCDSVLDISNAVDNTLDCYEPADKELFNEYEDCIRLELIRKGMSMYYAR